MKHPILCDTCEGTGLTTPDHPNDPSGRTFACHNGCTDGYLEATPSDLDGKRVRFGPFIGYVTLHRATDTLILEDENFGMSVLNLTPDDLEICHDQG